MDDLIQTFLSIGGREINVRVGSDGMSQWYDMTAQYSAENSNPNFGVKTLFPGTKERKHLKHIESEFTVDAKVPENVMQRLRAEIAAARKAGQKDIADAILEALLEPIFWREINEFLTPPIDKKYAK